MRIRLYDTIDAIRLIADVSLAFFVIGYCLFTDNRMVRLPIIGIGIIFYAIYMCVKTKESKELFLFMAILALINISLGVTDCFFYGEFVSAWQSEMLRSTEFNVITAKTILIMEAIINVPLTKRMVLDSKSLTVESFARGRRQSKLIAYAGLVVLFSILTYAIITLSAMLNQQYDSVSSPIYEYSIVVVCVVWFYARDLKNVEVFLVIYAIIFSLFFLAIGDRSSVFMLLVLMYQMYLSNKVKIWQILVLGVLSIIISNVISIMRLNPTMGMMELIANTLQRGLYQDTISWAYYGSISVVGLRPHIADTPNFLIGYLLSFIGIDNEYNSMISYARENYSHLRNSGGGLYSAICYGLGDYVGVIIGAIILAVFIRLFFVKSRDYYMVYRIIFIAMTLRWYLYHLTTLFRGIIILTSLLLICCEVIYGNGYIGKINDRLRRRRLK